MNIAHTLSTIARVHPDRPAIAWEGGGLSYGAFEDQVQRIAYADNETNYCARCQTDGRILADRAFSRLLHDSFPRRLDDS